MIKINPDIVYRLIDGKIFIADPSNSILYELNDTASAVWKLLSKKKYATDISLLIKALATEYDTDEKTLKKDITRLIKYFVRKKILILAPRITLQSLLSKISYR